MQILYISIMLILSCMSDYSSIHEIITPTQWCILWHQGGVEAPPGRFPWMVSVRDQYHNHSCGGFLVDEQYVMTAAHCYSIVGRNPILYLAAYNLSNDESKRNPESQVIWLKWEIPFYCSWPCKTFWKIFLWSCIASAFSIPCLMWPYS